MTLTPIHPLAGQPPPPESLVDIPKLIAAYYSLSPDPAVPAERVSFGTSGHRGSAFEKSFNEHHILAISQAICEYRQLQKIEGPLFLGKDTHALSEPALNSALEVLAANGVEVMLSEGDEFTPTPAISHAILTYNRGRKSKFADGIVITPSHNPPTEGGFKYNPPNGGPADTEITNWIESKANGLLTKKLGGVKRISYSSALLAPSTRRYNFLTTYVDDLANVLDMQTLRQSGIRLGVDPLGGAGVHYWEQIAHKYDLNLTVVNKTVDPTFRFMTLDWDGKIRMDPSSPYAMQGLIHLKDRFDIACACDTDHDRHGIVTRTSGLLPPNHFLSAAIYYLFKYRPLWNPKATVGKTLVSSQMIDRVTTSFGKQVYEVPTGFKWFVEGLLNGKLAFVGEESAGATFVRLDGSVWTTEKDGIIMGLLAAEITAKTGKNPGEIYQEITSEFGDSAYIRVDAPATPSEKTCLKNLSPDQISAKNLAGEKIEAILTRAPGNHAPIGGVKVIASEGWFAARPSGTENLYKIYAESFLGEEHLKRILNEAEALVSSVFLKEKELPLE